MWNILFSYQLPPTIFLCWDGHQYVTILWSINRKQLVVLLCVPIFFYFHFGCCLSWVSLICPFSLLWSYSLLKLDVSISCTTANCYCTACNNLFWRFTRPILHGLCTLGYAIRAIVNSFCNGEPSAVKNTFGRFLLHVYPGETLITEMWPDGSR